MAGPADPPTGVPLSSDVEFLGPGRSKPFRARVRWVDPTTRRRRSKSECVASEEAAQRWLDGVARAARGGVDPVAATMKLAEFGEAVMTLALRGLERKTL